MRIHRTFPLLAFAALLSADDEAGKIMRPADKSSHKSGTVSLVATAPFGRLELDGEPLELAQPFPNVFHGEMKVSPGTHSLVLKWAGGRKEVRFFSGPNAPAEFTSFQQHPPIADVACTQCHELTARGRFRFKGGCFDCHKAESFQKVHTHPSSLLEECGMCHNAHGSTVKAHLIHPKEIACKLCHP
ncbi:MAG: hypothetical protein NTV52_03235 [Acidobacteria bacterium]|nr:hypothetical protein [Acidobacteriota bacterium]